METLKSELKYAMAALDSYDKIDNANLKFREARMLKVLTKSAIAAFGLTCPEPLTPEICRGCLTSLDIRIKEAESILHGELLWDGYLMPM